MSPRAAVIGIVLVTTALMLPVAGWKLSLKSRRDEHVQTEIEKLEAAACAGRDTDVTKLLHKGISVNSVAPDGYTPLMASVNANHVTTVKLLLEHAPALETRYIVKQQSTGFMSGYAVRAPEGYTALLMAAQNGNFKTAKLLLAAGADAKAVSTNGSSTTSLALQAGNADALRLFLDLGVPSNVTSANGDSPLQFAINMRDSKLAHSAIKAGANVDVTDLNRETALLEAARTDALPDVELILARSARDVDIADAMGRTPLSYAAGYGRIEVVRALLVRGVNVNSSDAYHTTPLMYAAQQNNDAILTLLLAYGANVGTKDKNGMTALQWAKARGYSRIAGALSRTAASN